MTLTVTPFTPGDLPSTRAEFGRLQQQLADQGLHFRAPPPEPTSCCGRGCPGCVWEGFHAAALYWVEQSRALLAADGA